MGFGLDDFTGGLTSIGYDVFEATLKEPLKWADDALVQFDALQREKFVQGHKDLSVFAEYSYVDNMNFLKQLIDPWKQTHKLLGHDMSKVEDFEEKVFAAGKGFDFVFNKALDGDEKAMAMVALIVVSVLLTIYTWGGSSELLGATLAEVLAYASAAYSAYNYIDQFSAIKEIDDLQKQLQQTLAKLKKRQQEGYVDSALYGQKNDWMAGGTFYNAIYAGGELFNQTGSRAQTNFLGNQDMNLDDRFMWNNDRYHDFYKKLGTERIGTSNFSILKFSMV